LAYVPAPSTSPPELSGAPAKVLTCPVTVLMERMALLFESATRTIDVLGTIVIPAGALNLEKVPILIAVGDGEGAARECVISSGWK